MVPTEEALRAHPDPVELKNSIRESLQRTARSNHLHSYELPADFIIETTPFTIESGMLAAVGKPIRPKMIEHSRTSSPLWCPPRKPCGHTRTPSN
ncbi:putative fatty-acid-CoA ligase FadD [Mycobacteroides abscessus subsp. abscessus]|nr:putative fatty-acid-CoA ligase FadD [Mycobacteroides abscessus subsp. abscessus]